MEEVIVDAYVNRHENQGKQGKMRLLIEMYPSLPEGHGCVLAPLMVDVAINIMVPLCMFNPHSYPVVIRQDHVL